MEAPQRRAWTPSCSTHDVAPHRSGLRRGVSAHAAAVSPRRPASSAATGSRPGLGPGPLVTMHHPRPSSCDGDPCPGGHRPRGARTRPRSGRTRKRVLLPRPRADVPTRPSIRSTGGAEMFEVPPTAPPDRPARVHRAPPARGRRPGRASPLHPGCYSPWSSRRRAHSAPTSLWPADAFKRRQTGAQPFEPEQSHQLALASAGASGRWTAPRADCPRDGGRSGRRRPHGYRDVPRETQPRVRIVRSYWTQRHNSAWSLSRQCAMCGVSDASTTSLSAWRT